MSSPARYRGRFAPSPTGPLHFGSLVAALASYCDARASSGGWLVRIEDVDIPRAREDAEREIMAQLSAYGFRWDGQVVRQSQRGGRYAEALAGLAQRGVVYPCICTRRELESARLAASGERIYPGTCRNGIAAERAARTQRAWRVVVGDAVIAFDDRRQGPQRQALASEVGDFVLKRADGTFAYQLAVVVDDAEQEVSHIVRGADLLSSTARQIYLQRLLDIPTPAYLHVPVALNARGEKLSKQTLARELPEQPLPALLAAWRFLDQPPLASATLAEFWPQAIAAWTPSRVPPVPMLPAPQAFAALVK